VFVTIVVAALLPLQAPPTAILDDHLEAGGTPTAPAPVEALRDEPPPPEPATTPPAPPPTTPPPSSPAPAPVVTRQDGFFDDGQPGHYLAWYGPEYVVSLALVGMYLGGVQDVVPIAPALIGPQLSLERMDTTTLLDSRLDDVIGKRYVREKVPTEALIAGAAVVILGTTGADLAATGDLHRTNALFLGGLEALMGTVLVTEVTKHAFGRLRPDFRARYINAACTGTITAPADLDCAQADLSFRVDEEELKDGMKSFMSGHSSSSFAMATWGSWWLASTLILDEDRPDWGPAVSTIGIGALYSLAGFSAASRLSDNKHHPEDVAVGAAVGTAIATSIWFVHFDTSGRARRRGWQADGLVSDVTVVPALGLGETGTGSGLAVVGRLP